LLAIWFGKKNGAPAGLHLKIQELNS
jgi:hypothetical protein